MISPPYKIHIKNRHNGFMALTSLLIISSLLILLILYSSASTINAQQAFDRLYEKQQSRYRALSCIHEVILHISEDSSYMGNETIAIGSDPEQTCFIFPITNSGTSTIITTQVTNQYSKITLQAQVSAGLDIISILKVN